MIDYDPYDEEQKQKTPNDVKLAQLQELSATEQADTTFSGDTKVPKETSGGLPEPKGDEDQMWEEYDQWKSIGKAENPRWNLLRTGSIWVDDPELENQRNIAKEAWYLKWYGMNPNEYEALKNQNKEKYNNYSLEGFSDTIRNLTDISMGSSTDFVMDAVGTLPGLSALDNYYDRKTRSKTGLMQNTRRMLSIVVPSILSGSFLKTKTAQLPEAMSPFAKKAITMGAFTASEIGVIGLSDQGEEHNALRALNDFFPGVFGEKGWLPIPNWAKTLDSDSP